MADASKQAIKDAVAQYSTALSNLGSWPGNFKDGHCSSEMVVNFVAIPIPSPSGLVGNDVVLWNNVIGWGMQASKSQVQTNGTKDGHMNGFGAIFSVDDLSQLNPERTKSYGNAYKIKDGSELFQQTDSFAYHAAIAWINSFGALHNSGGGAYADNDGAKDSWYTAVNGAWSALNGAVQRL